MAFSWYTSFSHTARSRTQGMLDPSQKTAGMHVIHLRFIGEGEIVAELRVLRRCEGAQQPLLRENLYGQAFPTGVFTAGSGFLCFRPWEFSCFRAIFLGQGLPFFFIVYFLLTVEIYVLGKAELIWSIVVQLNAFIVFPFQVCGRV
ncbi:uncharacterized protein LOC110094585 isoform X2 [Dendrobium catenatum]|uniref:uncharacterized protein LOC110094585 isoform X1 n=1 Tax=Dendrobium catenatum TaxID=906689 RepID=UPI0010A02E0B|nr:uncharacterized protein LOC110094585 isoform X1 [Dendrobium catenatum]XP_028550346.1 uncharacterized protein LOC110094585 isoform X2 [Dendrobium catenatum]